MRVSMSGVPGTPDSRYSRYSSATSVRLTPDLRGKPAGLDCETSDHITGIWSTLNLSIAQ